MNRIARLFAVIGAVSVSLMTGSCGKEAAEAADANKELAKGQCFYSSPLPRGVVVDLPIHFRKDQIYKAKNGTMRRRVEVEYLEGSEADAMAAAANALLAQGYVQDGEELAKPGGNIARRFKLEGEPGIWVTVYRTAGRKPANPMAKGVIAFGWQIAGKSPKRL